MKGTRRKPTTAKAPPPADGTDNAPVDTPIDTTDYRILALLRKDGRTANRDLARALGHTETTIRARLRRLDTSGTMRVVAMTDFRAAGFQLMASIGVQIKDRDVVAVAEDIAKLPEIFNVQIVIGSMDIELSAGAADSDELAKLIHTLAQIPGVHRLTPGMALEVIKFDWGAVPIL